MCPNTTAIRDLLEGDASPVLVEQLGTSPGNEDKHFDVMAICIQGVFEEGAEVISLAPAAFSHATRCSSATNKAKGTPELLFSLRSGAVEAHHLSSTLVDIQQEELASLHYYLDTL